MQHMLPDDFFGDRRRSTVYKYTKYRITKNDLAEYKDQEEVDGLDLEEAGVPEHIARWLSDRNAMLFSKRFPDINFADVRKHKRIPPSF